MQTDKGILIPLHPCTEDKHTKNSSLSDKNFNPDLRQNHVFSITNSKTHKPNIKANIQDEKWEQQPHCKFTNYDNCYQFSFELYTIFKELQS